MTNRARGAARAQDRSRDRQLLLTLTARPLPTCRRAVAGVATGSGERFAALVADALASAGGGLDPGGGLRLDGATLAAGVTGRAALSLDSGSSARHAVGGRLGRAAVAQRASFFGRVAAALLAMGNDRAVAHPPDLLPARYQHPHAPDGLVAEVAVALKTAFGRPAQP